MSTHSLVALIILTTSLQAIPPALPSSRTRTSGPPEAVASRPDRPSGAVRTGTSACSRAAPAAFRVCSSSSMTRTVLRRRVRTAEGGGGANASSVSGGGAEEFTEAIALSIDRISTCRPRSALSSPIMSSIEAGTAGDAAAGDGAAGDGAAFGGGGDGGGSGRAAFPGPGTGARTPAGKVMLPTGVGGTDPGFLTLSCAL